jgi:predicted RNA-binding Zn-ribbon protein involved in translation (DUF1610 family)
MKRTNVCPTCGHKIGSGGSPPCPKCGSRSVRAGKAKNKAQRYLCSNRACRYIFNTGSLVNTLVIRKDKPTPTAETTTPPVDPAVAPSESQPHSVDESTPQP